VAETAPSQRESDRWRPRGTDRAGRSFRFTPKLMSFASDRAQVQNALEVVPNCAESAKERNHRRGARNRQD
jgi:hypothetical protein